MMNDRDELTGVFNKNALLNHLSRSIENIHLGQGRLILLCANIDNMKHFNAHNGHLKGDEMLKRFTAAVLPLLEDQQLFRYGGDSFAIVSQNRTLKEVAELAKQICEDARTKLSPSQPKRCGRKDCLGPARISVSMGIIKFEEGMSTDILLQNANNQLYEAKSAGRDCIYLNYEKVEKYEY